MPTCERILSKFYKTGKTFTISYLKRILPTYRQCSIPNGFLGKSPDEFWGKKKTLPVFLVFAYKYTVYLLLKGDTDSSKDGLLKVHTLIQ